LILKELLAYFGLKRAYVALFGVKKSDMEKAYDSFFSASQGGQNPIMLFLMPKRATWARKRL